MAGLSPKLPIQKDPVDGFALTKTFKEMVKQNFKNLMLTSPGERIMDPEFGVGLRRFLFQPMTSFVFSDIEDRIVDQCSTYLPFIEIAGIEFDTPEDDYSNLLYLRVEYIILPLSAGDVFEFTVSSI